MDYFDVSDLNVDRLLKEWRWLCSGPMTLIARNAFADLFLRDESGGIHELDVAVGELTKIAATLSEFQEKLATPEKKEEWFADSSKKAAELRGLKPGADQCIGFSIPVVFAESRSNNTLYIADIYEHVSFLGDLHRQIASVPDGGKVRLNLKPRP
jgi:hypothetical protein